MYQVDYSTNNGGRYGAAPPRNLQIRDDSFQPVPSSYGRIPDNTSSYQGGGGGQGQQYGRAPPKNRSRSRSMENLSNEFQQMETIDNNTTPTSPTPYGRAPPKNNNNISFGQPSQQENTIRPNQNFDSSNKQQQQRYGRAPDPISSSSPGAPPGQTRYGRIPEESNDSAAPPPQRYGRAPIPEQATSSLSFPPPPPPSKQSPYTPQKYGAIPSRTGPSSGDPFYSSKNPPPSFENNSGGGPQKYGNIPTKGSSGAIKVSADPVTPQRYGQPPTKNTLSNSTETPNARFGQTPPALSRNDSRYGAPPPTKNALSTSSNESSPSPARYGQGPPKNDPPKVAASPSFSPIGKYDWEFGSISREDAEKLLIACNFNAFLIRQSSQAGKLSFTKFYWPERRFEHSLINVVNGFYLFDGHDIRFRSLSDLVQLSGVFDGFKSPSGKSSGGQESSSSSNGSSSTPIRVETFQASAVIPENNGDAQEYIVLNSPPRGAPRKDSFEKTSSSASQRNFTPPQQTRSPPPKDIPFAGKSDDSLQVKIKFPQNYPIGSKYINLEPMMTVQATIESIVTSLKKKFPQANATGIGLFISDVGYFNDNELMGAYFQKIRSSEYVEFKYKDAEVPNNIMEPDWNGEVSEEMYTRPDLEGELEKYSADIPLLGKSWRVRWFIIQHNKMFFFKSKPTRFEEGLLGSIYLRDCNVQQISQGSRPYCIEIIEKGGKSFLLSCTNGQQELDFWLKTIKEASQKTEGAVNSIKHNVHIDDNGLSGLNNLISLDDPSKIYSGLEQIGRGGLADVYKAIDKRTNSKIALKIMKVTARNFGFLIPELINHKTSHHFNVVDFKDAYFLADRQELWVTLEFMNRGDLTSMLTAPGALIPMAEEEIGFISLQILNALNYLHQLNRVHRDLKSDNVLMNSKGEFKLADFGMAVQLTNQTASLKTVVGSPYWMAPEILLERNYGKEVDVWSFGCVVMEMVDGVPPYFQYPPEKATKMIVENGVPPLKNADRISSDLRDFISVCLEFDPKRRMPVDQLLLHPFVLKSATKANPFLGKL